MTSNRIPVTSLEEGMEFRPPRQRSWHIVETSRFEDSPTAPGGTYFYVTDTDGREWRFIPRTTVEAVL